MPLAKRSRVWLKTNDSKVFKLGIGNDLGISCALVLLETSALYKLFTYLLTYLYPRNDHNFEVDRSKVMVTGSISAFSH